MSALTVMRDHCRRMATARHTDDCHRTTATRRGGSITNRPDPLCPGCVPESDRVLWTRLADELDAYLAGDLCGVCGDPAAEYDGDLFTLEAQ